MMLYGLDVRGHRAGVPHVWPETRKTHFGRWESPGGGIKQRSPRSYRYGGLTYKIRHRPTLPRVTAVPSALAGLTSLFGMGRGGHRRYRHLNILR